MVWHNTGLIMLFGLQRTEINSLRLPQVMRVHWSVTHDNTCDFFPLYLHTPPRHSHQPLIPNLAGWSSPYFSAQIPECLFHQRNHLIPTGQSFPCQTTLQATCQPMNWLPVGQVAASGPISRCPLHDVQFRATSFGKALCTKAAFLKKRMLEISGASLCQSGHQILKYR